jgi:DNA adenine methylase
MKPFLRWAGSKAQLIPQLRDYWEDGFARYVEPFCGSATLFFSLEPRIALLSDANPELIHALRSLQCTPDLIVEWLLRHKTDARTYYRIRALDPSELSPNERAARFIYLNALCFNGLYRVNQAGIFNVPYGDSQDKAVYFDPIRLRQAGYLLRNADVECSDFEAVVDKTTKGDFVYLDPPYATASQRVFSEYGKDGFATRDIERLRSALLRADERGVKFLLSYADFPEIAQFEEKWPLVRVETKRNIAGFVSSRRKVTEVLITNCRHPS